MQLIFLSSVYSQNLPGRGLAEEMKLVLAKEFNIQLIETRLEQIDLVER